VVLLLLCSTIHLNAQTFTGENIEKSTINLSEITDFDVFQLEARTIADFIHSNEFDNKIRLTLGTRYDWEIDLYENDLFAREYKAYTMNHAQKNPVTKSDKIAYEGYLADGAQVRFSFMEGFFFGLIKNQDSELFIEPLYRMQPGANKDIYVVYDVENVIVNPNNTCGVVERKNMARQVQKDLKRLDTYSGSTTCRKVELATCADRSMFDIYGSETAVNDYIAGIINLVEIDYQNPNAFIYDLQFEIVEQIVITGNNPSAWSGQYQNNDTELNVGALNDFCGWASGGFSANYDLAQLWTDANLFTVDADGNDNFNALGIASLYGFCSSTRNCSMIEDFSLNTATMQETVSHEFGHNFGCPHNDAPGNNIMEPFVNTAANFFSPTSQLFGNASLVDCAGFSTCACIEILEVIPTDCDPASGRYNLLVTIEHNGNTGQFALNAGGIFANFNYGANVQTVILPLVPVGTNQVAATHIGDATCRDEVNYIEPQQNVMSSQSGYCVSDNNDYDLTGTDTEEFGSIRLTLLGDGYSQQESAAIIYDVNGAIMYDYFVSSFDANEQTVRNTGLLNLDYAPYTVIVGDAFGDGLQANTCFGDPELEGGYLVEDGQGNVIYGPATPPYGPLTPTDCDGNDAHSQAHTFTPAVESTFGGNFAGTGVTDATTDDGFATFNPATAGIGQHFIDYDFTSYYVRPNSFPFQKASELIGEYCERITINVYSEPQLEVLLTTCNDDGTYAFIMGIDLGEWNVISSGAASGLEVTVSAGMPLSNTTAGGNMIVNQIPQGTDVTFTVGGDSTGTCEQSITVTAPDCTPVDCQADSGDW